MQFYTLVQSFIRDLEATHYFTKANALDAELVEGPSLMAIDLMSTPGFAVVWADRKQWFTRNFQRYIDTEVLPKSRASNFRPAGV